MTFARAGALDGAGAGALPAGHLFPEVDVSLCDSEPIHIPGAIQPHGALLAVLRDTSCVTHASGNLAQFLAHSPASVLGRPLQAVLGDMACLALLDTGRSGESATDRVHYLRGPDGGLLYLRSFRSGAHVCIDIEPMHMALAQDMPIIMVQTVLDSFRSASNTTALCDLAVLGLRNTTGYDRVMAYRFGAQGHGEVVAEARAPHLEPFLGLRYPASDIPPQARQLYLRQRVGSIADSSYRAVPVLSDAARGDGTPLDLTHSALRSVSPVHCEYMRNMHTAASLTLSLVQGESLWGMLVCHHATARVPGPDVRAAANLIGQVVSLLLASVGEAEISARRLEREGTLRAVVKQLGAALPIDEAFAGAGQDLLRLVDADGAVLRLSGHLQCLGRTPPPDLAGRALEALHGVADGALLAIDDLGLRYPELAACTMLASGALLLPLASGPEDALLWVRPELAHTVTWGGDPHATGGRLSPRSSFAAWRQQVRGRSAPWSDADLALAGALREAVDAEVAQRTRAALQESEARLGLLAEHSGVVVALTDINGVRRYVSPAAERVLGWRAEDLVDRPASELVHPDDQITLRDAISAMLAGAGQSSACYRQRRPDGSWMWVDGHARLRTRPDAVPPTDYVVVLRDATERKAAEDKLMDALERMERMAATDGLTGLANRRHLDATARKEWRRCLRERLPLSVLILDADHFKAFNDRYGHLAGDDCLRAVASEASAAAQRPGDLAARFGGEEFVLLLPATDPLGASVIAHGLRARVQALQIDHAGNPPVGVVTVSIGVATAWPAEPACGPGGFDAVVARADAALYRAKSGGRNQVVEA